MLKLIVGKKGSGKTKLLIEGVNGAAKESKGNVVCIEKGMKLRYDLSLQVKLIDIDEYRVEGFGELYGFLAGLTAGNYDITDIYVDGLFKICPRDYEAMEKFFEKVALLSVPHGVQLVFTVSADISELPESVKQYI
ncbi:MAG TPA: hypothetical protein PK854_05225 [Oscillospiraceae bacterium]|nr:hypothetical protein [Oscillospiraceae bacterium]HPS34649.1 hypothetical protein [Oscillospiraceae bacterium]